MRLLESRIPLTLLLDLAPVSGPPSEAIMRLEQRQSSERSEAATRSAASSPL
ncbi:MAG: hypothetical protein ACYDB7_13920 [Mycobacteriales bacterium]